MAPTLDHPSLGPTPQLDANMASDPFSLTSNTTTNHRYSNFDTQLFSLGPASSPAQAKRALEAHLAETERRIQDASKLGTSLVEQRRDLSDRLKELQHLEAEQDMSPELKRKLAEIEKEFNEVGRESARAFLPKSRVVSTDVSSGSPMIKRSLSPTKFESNAVSSPSKLSVPNRKQRNQSANRVHDIEFATEISSSLLIQVRELQGLLAEKEESLRTVTLDKSRLEAQAEGFHQRLRSLDESENRYKDENWNLETQIHEHIASAKEAADREKKLTQTAGIHQMEKNAALKELDDIKLSHSKLTEDHALAIKHHDTELGGLKRNLTMMESERDALHRKISELTSQNQELAVAYSQSRNRAEENGSRDMSADSDFFTAGEDQSLDDSPPASPMKGTARHSALETETLKSSLGHAHRMIQGLKGNIHKEKTEKLELKRMLQDARDELDTKRNDSTANASMRKSRKVDNAKDLKKSARPGALGGMRNSRSEVYTEDPIWEDNDDQSSPVRSLQQTGDTSSASAPFHTRTGEDYVYETSDAFETANERNTETDDFHTGREDSSDDLTETEMGPSPNRMKRPSHLSMINRMSFQSTASDDEELYRDPRTPRQSHISRSRPQSSKDDIGRPRAVSDATSIAESTSEYSNSNHSTPLQPGNRQSLFAELEDLSDDDEDETDRGTPASMRHMASPSGTTYSNSPRTVIGGTPRSVKSVALGRGLSYNDTPLSSVMGSAPALAPSPLKVEMVDAGVMTDEWQPPPAIVETASPDKSAEDHSVEPLSTNILTTAAASVVGAMAGFLGGTASANNRDSTMSDASSQWQDHPSSELLSESHRDLRPLSNMSGISFYSDMGSQYEDIEERLASFPSPPSTPAAGLTLANVSSALASEQSTPRSGRISASARQLDSIPAPLTLSAIHAQILEPIAEPVTTHSDVALADVRSIDRSAETITNANGSSRPSITRDVQSTSHDEGYTPSSSEDSSLPPSASKAFSTPSTPRATQQSAQEPLQLNTPTRSPLALSTLQFVHAVSPRDAPRPETPVREPFHTTSIVAVSQSPRDLLRPSTPVRTPLAYSTIAAQAQSPYELPRPITPVRGIPILQHDIPLSFSTVKCVATEPIAPTKPEHDSGMSSGILSGLIGGAAGLFGGAALGTAVGTKNKNIAPEEDKDNEISLLNSESNLDDTKDTTLPPATVSHDIQSKTATAPRMNNLNAKRPLGETSGNANAIALKQSKLDMSDEGSQTALTSAEIDNMFKDKSTTRQVIEMGAVAPSSVRPSRSAQHLKGSRSIDSLGTVGKARAKMADPDYVHDSPDVQALLRKSSISSIHPPLPTDHKQVIAAAASRGGSSGSMAPPTGLMGPPLMSASAMKPANTSLRPRTPSQSQGHAPIMPVASPVSVKTNNTNHGNNKTIQQFGTAQVYAPTGHSGRVSRQSSVSSFASEVDTRFNLRNGMPMPHGMDQGTDPRMIQAITQTMIGEYLWKYTRKAGRGEMSENRHRRYFWVHPYTRTLYWSDRDPSQAGRAQLKAKSVAIEAVRVVTDDNPMPPGLHRKSLVILTPGRTVKFTATTGQRHETWFNALSYLLQRTDDRAHDTETVATGAMNKEDVAGFNSSYNTHPAGAAPSVTSYSSRAIRNESPVRRQTPVNLQQPTLNATPQLGKSPGTFSRLSNYWRPSSATTSPGTNISPARSRSRASISRLRGYGASNNYDTSIMSDAHDSAEDLREMIEQQDRDSDRLENVRACCDGKHDVSGMHIHQHHSSIGSRKGKSHLGSSGTGALGRMRSQSSIIPEGREGGK